MSRLISKLNHLRVDGAGLQGVGSRWTTKDHLPEIARRFRARPGRRSVHIVHAGIENGHKTEYDSELSISSAEPLANKDFSQF